MAAYTAVNLGVLGTVSNPQAVTSSDTISGNDIANGAILEVKNASGGSINVTFTDPGHTPAGNTGTQAAIAVAAGTTKRIKPAPALVDPSSNLITVNYSATASVTYELYT